MADSFSEVLQNVREEFLSTDFVRAQQLTQTQALNVLRDDARTNDTTNAAFLNVSAGARVSGCSLVPTLSSTSGFAMALSAGQALVDDGSSDDLNLDTSSTKVYRWAAATVTFGTPDASNPRIDLVVVTGASVNTDVQSRNILLNPTTRQVAPQSVPKTSNPAGVVSVVAGTAAGTPVPPAVPAGSIALFEVLIPAAAGDSSSFEPSRRINRRIEFPLSSYHGILQNCVPQWTQVDESTTTSAISLPTGIVHKVVIDGEVITFGGGNTVVGGGVVLPLIVRDANATYDPFGAAAPAGYDLPYYIYACGGRHLPQGAQSTQSGFGPIVLVESLVEPDSTGRPSLNVQTPRGNTVAGAVLIACGWVVKNSTKRKGVTMAGNWVYPNGSQYGGLSGSAFTAFYDGVNPRADSNSAATAVTLHSKPTVAISQMISFVYGGSDAGIAIGQGASGVVVVRTNGTALTGAGYVRVIQPADLSPAFGLAAAEVATSVFAIGYELGIKRLSL